MSKSKNNKKNRKFNHPCTVESLEERLLLSVAPADVDALQVGSLYIEGTFGSDQLTDDSYGDYLEISYNGGVQGTNLDKLEINLDKNDNGQVDINEAFFHLAKGNPEYGAYNSVKFEIVDANGTIKTGDVKWTISNNNQLLTMEFEDFESGDKLVCRFDVDFYKGVSPIYDEDGDIIDRKESSNVTVNGDDFEGSRIKAYFSADNYEDVSIEKTYIDNFGAVKYGLDLQENAYFPEDVTSADEYVAGAFGTVVQTPIVNTVSGYVYDDIDGSLTLTSADELLSNVTLTLYELDSTGNYVSTGLTTTTDANGFYEFTDLFNGTYMVLETQPENYTAVCANAGYVPSTTQVSTVRDLNCIYKIELKGNQDSIQNNFGQNSPGQLSGIVWLDANLNDIYDAGDTLLKDVKVNLYDDNGTLLATTKTDSNGYYEFTGLYPGLYTVEEEWPTQYIHSGEIPGTTGGYVDSDDDPGFIYDIVITSRGISESNNFWEILPGMISGYVFEDNQAIERNPDGSIPDQYKITTGVKTPDSVPIPGVTLGLYNIDGTVAITDAEGKPLTTVTDQNGYYEFTHLMPGSYCVIETQPKAYIDGLDTAGTGGGWAFNPTDAQYDVTVKQFGTDRNNDAIIRISVKSGENSALNNFAEVNVVDPTPTPTPGGGEKIPKVSYPHVTNSSGGGFQSVPYIPAYMTRGISALYGGGGSAVSAWHLCSLNAGMARRLGDGVVLNGLQGEGLTTDMTSASGMSASGLIANGLIKEGYGMEALINMFSPIFDPINWNGRTDPELAWNMADWRDGSVTFVGEYGVMEGIPLTGDFNGDGKDELAVFVDGVWFIDINGNGFWDADDLWVQLGERGDQPVVGDWDGDGKADIGVYGKIWAGDWDLVEHDPGLPDAENLTRGVYKNMRPRVAVKTAASGFSKLTSTGAIYEKAIDHVFHFGNQGDRAITGDWNGDGVDNIGVFSNGNWYLDVDGNGRLTSADRGYDFGTTGDIPVTGDWTGDGVTNIGVYRNGKFILDTNANGVMDESDAVVESGDVGDIPISGDFNGDGVDEVGTVKLSGVRQ